MSSITALPQREAIGMAAADRLEHHTDTWADADWPEATTQAAAGQRARPARGRRLGRFQSRARRASCWLRACVGLHGWRGDCARHPQSLAAKTLAWRGERWRRTIQGLVAADPGSSGWRRRLEAWRRAPEAVL